MKKLLLSLVLLLPSLYSTARADTLYVNALFYTVNPDQPLAQALIERGGKIAFIGTEAEARKQTNGKTTVVDLKGQTVIPGFIEGHGHLISIGFAQLNLDLMTVANYEALEIGRAHV